MLINARKLAEGDMLPPFYYGLAYHDWASDYSRWYIIPINYFIRWAKWIQHKWNRFRSRRSWIDKEIIKAIAKKDGEYKEKLKEAWHEAQYYRDLCDQLRVIREYVN